MSRSSSFDSFNVARSAPNTTVRTRKIFDLLFLLSFGIILISNHSNSGSLNFAVVEAYVAPFLNRQSFPLNHVQRSRRRITPFLSLEISNLGKSARYLFIDHEKEDTISTPYAASKEKVDRSVVTDFVADTELPTDLGRFRLRAYRVSSSTPENALGEFIGREPCVIYSKKHPPGLLGCCCRQEGVVIRVHDQCFTSEVMRSQRCDCKQQLNMALKYIDEHGGIVIYLQQEGRGIGIANKIAAYALQDGGMDTVDANLHLGLPEDCRQYGVVPSILDDLGIDSIKLMTNNPMKVERLTKVGVNVLDTVPMVVEEANEFNRKYLQTKKDRMNHTNFGGIRNMVTKDTESIKTTTTNGVMKPKRSKSSTITKPTLLNGDSLNSDTTASDGYCFGRKSVEDAIAATARGELVVVVDDENTENEGDLIMAADLITPETMAVMIRCTSGVVRVGMQEERMDELNLPVTSSSISVVATSEHGITTGISATDRATTIRLLADPKKSAGDFHRAGHVFPVCAKQNGVLTSTHDHGYTEASVDLARLAGCNPVGVCCELVSEENPIEMARLPELKKICKERGFVMTSIGDIAQYRRDTGL